MYTFGWWINIWCPVKIIITVLCTNRFLHFFGKYTLLIAGNITLYNPINTHNYKLLNPIKPHGFTIIKLDVVGSFFFLIETWLWFAPLLELKYLIILSKVDRFEVVISLMINFESFFHKIKLKKTLIALLLIPISRIL